MKKALLSLASLVLGITIFVAAILSIQPKPVLRATEDSAIHAAYIAPEVHFAGTVPVMAQHGKAKFQGGRLGLFHGHKATAQVVSDDVVPSSDTANDMAEDIFAGLGLGNFSTQAARDYRTVKFHSKVPNPQYVRGKCTLCGK